MRTAATPCANCISSVAARHRWEMACRVRRQARDTEDDLSEDHEVLCEAVGDDSVGEV